MLQRKARVGSQPVYRFEIADCAVGMLLRQQLEEQVYQLGKTLAAWAQSQGDEELRAQMDFSFERLRRDSYPRLAERAQTVLDTALPLIEALAPYEVDAGAVQTLESLLTQYRIWLPATRTAITRRSRSTQVLGRQYKAVDAQLKTLDVIMETKRGTVRYIDYRKVRRLAGANRAIYCKIQYSLLTLGVIPSIFNK